MPWITLVSRREKIYRHLLPRLRCTESSLPVLVSVLKNKNRRIVPDLNPSTPFPLFSIRSETGYNRTRPVYPYSPYTVLWFGSRNLYTQDQTSPSYLTVESPGVLVVSPVERSVSSSVWWLCVLSAGFGTLPAPPTKIGLGSYGPWDQRGPSRRVPDEVSERCVDTCNVLLSDTLVFEEP